MFLFRRFPVESRSRLRALRGLSRIFLRENSREARGLRLLRNWLSSEQRTQFDAKRFFDVIGCDSGKLYRIQSCRTCMRSTPLVAPKLAGVLCPLVAWSRATLCSPKRLPWRRMNAARWRSRMHSYPKHCRPTYVRHADSPTLRNGAFFSILKQRNGGSSASALLSQEFFQPRQRR